MLNLLRWVFAGAVGRNDRDISGVPAFEDVSSRRRLSGHELGLGEFDRCYAGCRTSAAGNESAVDAERPAQKVPRDALLHGDDHAGHCGLCT